MRLPGPRWPYNASEFLVDHLDHVSDLLVLLRADKPLPEVALDRDVQLLLLVRREPRLLDFRLNLGELRHSEVQHLLVVARAEKLAGGQLHRLRLARDIIISLQDLPRQHFILELDRRE